MKKVITILMVGLMLSGTSMAQDLPAGYEKIAGVWKFDQLFADGEDFTEKFVEGRLGGQKFVMTLNEDGSGSYDDFYAKKKDFVKLKWEYIPREDRKEREPDIDFALKNYNSEGGYGKEKYQIEKIDDSTLILNNAGLGMKMIFKRQ